MSGRQQKKQAQSRAATPRRRRSRRSRSRSRSGRNNVGFSAPVALAKQMRSSQPQIKQTPFGQRVVHRELIYSDVAGDTTFNLRGIIPVNPGLSLSFPWLSSIAGNYKEYRFHSLRFEYEPMVPTTTRGVVYLAPDYDAMDYMNTKTEVQVASFIGAVSVQCWTGASMAFDPKLMNRSMTFRYVRDSIIAGDMKTYDVGYFVLGVNNQIDTSTIGKLWVSYDVEFAIPQYEPLYDKPSRTVNYLAVTNQAASTINTLDFVVWSSVNYYDPWGVTFSIDRKSFYLPKGVYVVTAQVALRSLVNDKFWASVTIVKAGVDISSQDYKCNSSLGGDSIVSLKPSAVVSSTGIEAFQVGISWIAGTAGTFNQYNADFQTQLTITPA